MNQNPYEHLKFRKDGEKGKRIDPETWFHRWIRILLTVVALGFWAMAIGELLVR